MQPSHLTENHWKKLQPTAALLYRDDQIDIRSLIEFQHIHVEFRSQTMQEPSATVHFGGFPVVRRPLQLALRKPDGTVLRFGTVLRRGPSSGFHSPRTTDPRETRRFISTALRTHTLISNGDSSFRKRIHQREDRQVQPSLLPCLELRRK